MMNELTALEKRIKQTYQLSEMTPEFSDHLEAKLKAYQPNARVKTKCLFHLSCVWTYGVVTFLLVGVMVLAIGPSKVLAQIQATFGFIQNVGLVDTSSHFRQLAEPVSGTRDGITLDIQSAFLSYDGTIITYTMSNLPSEITQAKFGEPECQTPVYLNLPDGSKVEASGSRGGILADGSFVHEIRFSEPFPSDVNQATLVFPCLEGTAREKGPQDWQFALTFKLAPEDIGVYPVTLMPSQINNEANAIPADTSSMPAVIVNGDRQEEMVVLGVVENPESYWVTWAYPDKYDNDIQIDGHLYVVPFNPVLYDANGTELPSPDHETQLEMWKYEDSLLSQLSNQDELKYAGNLHTFAVPKSGVVFPVYARQDLYERSFPEKEAFAEIEFDGTRVQISDQPLEINQEIQLGSVKFKLATIEKNQYGGYTFLFDGTEGKVVQCQADLVGYTTNMGGGSSYNPEDPFHFYRALTYQQIPTGKLTVRVSQPAVMGDLISFIGSWSPDQH